MLKAEVHWDRVVTCYPERARNLADQTAKVAAERPDAVAVVEGDDRLSYADLYAEAGSLAAPLAADGVGAGDRVAVMLANDKIQKAELRERAAALGEAVA